MVSFDFFKKVQVLTILTILTIYLFIAYFRIDCMLSNLSFKYIIINYNIKEK